ncbi:MAG: amino acid ABC transporter ATP-binding protein [Ruminococcaceae bacterium]|nr:amino acid ABC transporter ATP-binding protein [Oscillospiraceae bacterium]
MALLEVRDITKSFGRTDVLKGISFDLYEGNVLSIIGSSGSGKTTLLRCINFLESADGGTVSINDEIVYDAEWDKKTKKIAMRNNCKYFGMVFQNFNLFPQYNVLDNITLAPILHEKALIKSGNSEYSSIKEATQAIQHNALELIETVGLSEKIKNYPCELSGGQQQRVAIARALAMQPDILCFDEPTSALDPELTGEVLKVIRELSERGRTMIVVTHEMEFARQVSDHVIFMADGVIEEFGAPEDLFGNPQSEVLRTFLGGISK